MQKYVLPQLPYGLKDLEPFISETQLTLHYQKHHASYVTNANAILDTIEKARKEGTDLDMKSVLKNLSFNVGGIVLHTLFWENLAPVSKGGGGMPSANLGKMIEVEFGSFDRFKKEFSATALSVEGSGWAALVADGEGRLSVMQIEKHNVNIFPGFKILLVLDVWEHAYYLDYKNERAKFIEAFWNIVNWKKVEERT